MSDVCLVQQEYDYSCGVACLSMALGIDQKKIQNMFFQGHDFTKYGIAVEKMIKVLEESGDRYYRSPTLIMGVPGILYVPSLNQVGAKHFIYYDGKKLLDPNLGRPNRLAYNHDILITIAHIAPVKNYRTRNAIVNQIDYLENLI